LRRARKTVATQSDHRDLDFNPVTAINTTFSSRSPMTFSPHHQRRKKQTTQDGSAACRCPQLPGSLGQFLGSKG
ncbi:hypothetical protein, partial [Rubinisphaera sp.]|uniref:hypothetical protein n=1 Tax=Rubinisphaera sp. TaxID=2024857 RepID=UPI0025D818AF